MPEIQFNKGDLLAATLVPPDWYKGIIVHEETKMREGVMDYIIRINYEDALLAQDERYIEHTFWKVLAQSTKTYLIEYMAALLGKNIKEVTDGMAKGETFGFGFGEGQNVGKRIQFRVEHNNFAGTMQNRIVKFIPYSLDKPTTPFE